MTISLKDEEIDEILDNFKFNMELYKQDREDVRLVIEGLLSTIIKLKIKTEKIKKTKLIIFDQIEKAKANKSIEGTFAMIEGTRLGMNDLASRELLAWKDYATALENEHPFYHAYLKFMKVKYWEDLETK